MPYIPRRYPSTLSVPPELTSAPKTEHKPLPVIEKAVPSVPASDDKKRLGLAKINLRTYEPDQQKLIEAMLGKGAVVQDATGQLIMPKKELSLHGAQNP